MQINARAMTLTSVKIAMVVASKSVTIHKGLTIVHVAVDSYQKKVIEKNAKKLKTIITIHIWRHQEEFMTMMIYSSFLSEDDLIDLHVRVGPHDSSCRQVFDL